MRRMIYIFCDWCGCAFVTGAVVQQVRQVCRLRRRLQLSCAVGLGDSWLLLMIGQALRAAINRCVIVRSPLVEYYEALRAVRFACVLALALPKVGCRLALKVTRVLA